MILGIKVIAPSQHALESKETGYSTFTEHARAHCNQLILKLLFDDFP